MISQHARATAELAIQILHSPDGRTSAEYLEQYHPNLFSFHLSHMY